MNYKKFSNSVSIPTEKKVPSYEFKRESSELTLKIK